MSGGRHVGEALLFGFISAVSLQIGSIIGVTCLPPRKFRAMLMSFGGGALLFALSIELFGHALHVYEEKERQGDSYAKAAGAVWLMEFSAVVGGVFFAALNRFLNSHGADVRHHATKMNRCVQLREALLKKLTIGLWKVPLLVSLSLEDIFELIKDAMYRERFGPGDVVMASETYSGGVYFIVSGHVRVEAYEPPQTRLTRHGEHHVQNGFREPSKQRRSISKGTPVGIRPGELLIKQLDELETLSARSAIDKEWLLKHWDLGVNQIFGDIAVLTGSSFTTRVVAETDTKVLVLPAREVERMISENQKVSEEVFNRAVERLRQITIFELMCEEPTSSIADQCSLHTYQPSDIVFSGVVDEKTSLVYVVIGSVEMVDSDTDQRKVYHVNDLLCTEDVVNDALSRTVSPVNAEEVRKKDITNFLLGSGGVKEIASRKTAPVLTVDRSTICSGLSSPIGESDAKDLVSHAEREITIRALEPTTVLIIERSQLRLLHKEDPVDYNVDQDQSWVLASDSGEQVDSLPGQILTPNERDRPPLVKQISQGGTIRHVAPDITTKLLREVTHLACTLGWEYSDKSEVEEGHNARLVSKNHASGDIVEHLITDQEIEEYEVEIRRAPDMSLTDAERRLGSKGSSSHRASKISRRSDGSTTPSQEDLPSMVHVPSIEEPPEHNPAADGHQAVMIWLGILIDAVPESLIIGILINKSVEEQGNAAAGALPFIIGVFLSNLPESMGSAGSMKSHGMRVSTILLMWLAITLLTAIGAAAGSLMFPAGSEDGSTETVVHAVEGVAAGAMLTMIAQTMMPEAFEQGGDIVGLSCLAGFLSASCVRLIPL